MPDRLSGRAPYSFGFSKEAHYHGTHLLAQFKSLQVLATPARSPSDRAREPKPCALVGICRLRRADALPRTEKTRVVELRKTIAADGLPGPRIFTTGPHIDGEHPAYPADSVVARDPEEARRLAERNVQEGATALKIYFRLPVASAKSVMAVCDAHHIPCPAHPEILNAPELIDAGLQGPGLLQDSSTRARSSERCGQE